MTPLALGFGIGLPFAPSAGAGAGHVYDPDTLAYLARMDTQPNEWSKLVYDYFVRQAKALGLWSVIVDCAFACGHEQSLAIKGVKGALTPSFVGSGGSFVRAHGLAGGGTLAIDTGYKIPAAKQNACAMGVLVTTYGGETVAVMGNANSAFSPRSGATNIETETSAFRMSAATTALSYRPYGVCGMWTALRTSATSMALYRDEVKVVAANATASQAPDAVYSMWVMGRNGATPQYSAHRIAFWHISESMTETQAAQLATLVQEVCGYLAAAYTALDVTPETRGLLAKMAEMGRRREYLIGAFYTTTWHTPSPYLVADMVATTGKFPSVMTVDWVDTATPGREEDAAQQLADIKAHHAAGGIISMMHHSGNPVTGLLEQEFTAATGTGTTYDTTGNPVAACLTGGSKRAVYVAYCYRKADWLNALKDDNGRPIPVMLRWFHEIDGGWFWWSSGSAANIAQLYRDFVDRLRERGVNNVVFDYNCNLNEGRTPAFGTYPGDSYVDIISGDFYDNDLSVQGVTSANAASLRTTAHWKPVWYAEFGYQQLANNDATIWSVKTGGNLSKYQTFMSGCAMWRSTWGHTAGATNSSDFAAMVADSRCITRDRLPDVYGRARSVAA